VVAASHCLVVAGKIFTAKYSFSITAHLLLCGTATILFGCGEVLAAVA